MDPSINFLRASSLLENPKTSSEKPPRKEFKDTSKTSLLEALITSTTLSASLKDSFPFMKALFVNSPGPASSKPTPLKRSTIEAITARPP